MKYNIISDIKAILELLNISVIQLAEYLKVNKTTIYRIIQNKTEPSDLFLENFYSFAYSNKIRNLRINELKVRLAKENHEKILFHGARLPIQGQIDIAHSRLNIDLGQGFYLGESYEQASSYIFANKKSSIYIFDISKLSKMKTIEFDVSTEWMIAVCYYRGQLEEYKNSQYVKRIIEKVERSEVVIAPIADNNMYDIINRFARGDITDIQATIALSASHLGKQHVLRTNKACENIEFIDRLYLCEKERDDIEEKRREAALASLSKANSSIKNYRHNGKYIEELLNE